MATYDQGTAQALQDRYGGNVTPTGDGRYEWELGGASENQEVAMAGALDANSYQDASIGLAYEQLGVSAELAGAQMEIAAKQAALADRQQAMSEEQYAYWKKNYKPLEQQLNRAASVGIDPNYYAARAGSDVTAAADKSAAILDRNLARQGIDASSAKYDQMKHEAALARTAAEAGAKTQARGAAADVNYQRKLNVASLGRNIPSTAASISATSAQTYGAAAGTQRGAADTYNAGYNSAIGANQNAAAMGLSASQFNAQLGLQQQQLKAQQQAAVIGAVGQAVGTGTGVGLAMMCWVAREVYGENNPRWLMFRRWVLERASESFRTMYLQHGPRLARWLADNTQFKPLFREWMDARIAELDGVMA